MTMEKPADDVRSLVRLREQPRIPPRQPSWPPCPDRGNHREPSLSRWQRRLQ
jgi:hypothetical protein